MDDLNGLSWSSSSNDARKPPPMSSGLLFPNVRMSDTSGRSTPLSGSSGPSIPPSKPATPASDSFANLVSFGSSTTSKNLSLLEQQKKLQEERAKKEAEKRSRFEAQYGAQNVQFWDNLEQGGAKPPSFTAATTQQMAQSADEDDILAAFNASAPVDASTHFPVPNSSPSPPIETTSSQRNLNGSATLRQGDGISLFDDDDDPFGLNQLKPKTGPVTQAAQNDDDDFLGDLSKPVSEFARPEPQAIAAVSSGRDERRPPPRPSDGVDRAIAELVDMGFPADKAREALSTTTSGTDVQAAVGWLLSQAHAESRQKARERATPNSHHDEQMERSRERSERRDREVPLWMRDEASHPSRSRSANRTPVSGDRDAAQLAANFGNTFLKTANSLWKSGSKKMQQVVNELNADRDPSQPRWMRDVSVGHDERRQPPARERQQAPTQAQETPAGFTDEALLLESGSSRPSRASPRQRDELRSGAERNDLRNFSPAAPERRTRQPPFMQQQSTTEARDPRSRVTKIAVEEQSAQAYVSPARRRRPVAQPSAPEPNVDLFESSAPSPAERPRPSAAPTQPQRSSTSASTLPVRPKAPPRVIPQVSQTALVGTHRQREKGAEAYKRGDYPAAHESFTAALTMLPEKHPITIIIRSNRAMTALKIGEPKAAIDDADAILALIGPSKGEAETIELGNGEPGKPMKDFFGKALMRKAEALEQLERWGDAAKAWRQAVEAGYGGSTSIQGRNRCEKAAGISKPTPKAAVPVKKTTPVPKKTSAVADLAGASTSSAASYEAVNRLRAANEAAERADEEKFALSENVDARLAAWKGGKQDNLRALLASLDSVLWPEAGWKKINMSELIMPNKVKVQYMKGIAKVHPDKIPTNATTEQRMIAGAVFGTLNDAWDKFKKENNL